MFPIFSGVSTCFRNVSVSGPTETVHRNEILFLGSRAYRVSARQVVDSGGVGCAFGGAGRLRQLGGEGRIKALP